MKSSDTVRSTFAVSSSVVSSSVVSSLEISSADAPGSGARSRLLAPLSVLSGASSTHPCCYLPNHYFDHALEQSRSGQSRSGLSIEVIKI